MKDYLSTYTGQNMPSKQVPKVPEPSFVTFGTSQVARSRQNSTPAAVLTFPKAPTSQVPKVAKPKRARYRAGVREPYYLVCVEVTRGSDGQTNHREADKFYAALAISNGYKRDELIEMLGRHTPVAVTTPDYCIKAVELARANINEILTDERLRFYAERHPFAWEVGLRSHVKEQTA